jgi:hypothetical protein
MTELEWLKQESGLDDAELKAMEAVAGHTKFVGMLQKLIASSDSAKADKATAEAERLALEKRYQDEFIPEMRKVTQDSVRAQGEAAAARAALEAARQYGIVPEEEKKAPTEVRAPGSPDPAAQAAEFQRWSQAQSRSIITLNDLNAEHFKLFKEPLSNSAELVDAVQREHTIGHRDYTLQKAWEAKYNVPAKRAELQAEEQKKHDDQVRNDALKEYKQAHGDNPQTRTGQPSRFSTYKPSDAGGQKPWQVPAGGRKAASQPWRDAAAAKVSAA